MNRRVEDWDVDGLSVWCDECTARDNCADCEERYDEMMAAVYEESMVRFGRPYSGWHPDHDRADKWAEVSVELQKLK